MINIYYLHRADFEFDNLNPNTTHVCLVSILNNKIFPYTG